MSTGHPLGDFLHGLLCPCENGEQLIFREKDIPNIRSRFLKEAYGLNPEIASDVVLTGIGILNETGQTRAARQLLHLLIETVERTKASFNQEHFRRFNDYIRSFEDPAKQNQNATIKKAKEIIPLGLPIRS